MSAAARTATAAALAVVMGSIPSGRAAAASPVRGAEIEGPLTVEATAYNCVPEQTQGDPSIAAWGDRLTPGINAVAVSNDLLELGLSRGTRVRIEGLSGEFLVLDRMPAQWSRKIDIYMGKDITAARNWGRRRVRIYWQAP